MKSLNRAVALILCVSLLLCGCSGADMAEKLLTSIAENESIQQYLNQLDMKNLSADTIEAFKNSYPVLKEFLAREDVQEKFETVGIPLIQKFLEYTGESMRLKAETLADVIRIFAPELTGQVDALFEGKS